MVQVYWANNLIQTEEKQFNHKVKIALINAGYKLRLIHHSTIDKVHLVKQISDESFIVEVQDIVNPLQIDSLLLEEFQSLEVARPFKIAIYDCFTDSVLYSHSGSRTEEVMAAEEYGVNWDINSYNFGVIFQPSNIYQRHFKSWIGSFGVIIILTSFFIYVINLIIRQKKLDEMKTDFINNMTHELKTPISTISLSSQVINNPNILEHPERLKRYSEIIQQENSRLKSQVERVLQIAFFEKQNIQLNFNKSNFKELISNAIKPFEILLEECNGEIKIDGNDIEVEVDEHHFTNVVSNLIDNAIKYAGAKAPSISVHWTVSGTNLKLSVKDNGIGMTKDSLKNIFKKFYRVHTGNVHDVKGFGIGLSYVDLMIEKHQGIINVKSELNKGTNFEITIPLKQVI